ncbi:MAG: AAA family ATPase [Methanosarcinaceae archaeon]|nr:AAA family ATPase [Methanosarcinaceae archaeon]
MTSEDRIPTGIAGLDRIIEGGLRDNTTFLVVGSSGTGKSTFAMQYLTYGLEQGENALYVSMEEPPEQIMREAEMLGFNMKKYYNKELFFFHTKGKDFVELVEEQLPALVEANKEYDVKTRVVIDPLTPLIWSVKDKQEQREIITKLFYTLKQLGPVLITTEEHAAPGETIGEDVLIPIYLSDGAVHLSYRPIGGAFNRSLEIVKMRATRHGEEVYPYIFVRGIGVVARTNPPVSADDLRKYDDMFEKAIKTARDFGAPDTFLVKLQAVMDNWSYSFSPKETLQILFETYNITSSMKNKDAQQEAIVVENVTTSSSESLEEAGNMEYVEESDDMVLEDTTNSHEGDLIDIDDLSELEDLIN